MVNVILEEYLKQLEAENRILEQRERLLSAISEKDIKVSSREEDRVGF